MTNAQTAAQADFRKAMHEYLEATEKQDALRKRLADATKAANSAYEAVTRFFAVFDAALPPPIAAAE